jgi:hypothetical protein
MNEAVWLACTDPTPMLDFLRDLGSDRKFRLFGLSCCHDIAPLLDPRSLSSLATVERYADGLRSRSTLARTRAAATQVLEEASQGDRGGPLVVKWLCHDDVWLQCGGIARESADFLASRQPRHLMKAVRRLALLNRARLLRDVFTPFRPTVFVPQWRTQTVVALATGIYEERAFDRLPILADALEESGCDNADVLSHCRGPGPHVRGCWVVDLVFGRE